MSLARLVVTAVRIEGRTKAEVARDYGLSRRWVYALCRRFDAEGEAGLEPRSRRPPASPGRTCGALEDEIVELRNELMDQGLDAGAHTIAVPPEQATRPIPGPGDDLADLVASGLHHSPASEAPEEFVRAVRGGDGQRAVAGRYHPLEARRCHRGRDPERDR